MTKTIYAVSAFALALSGMSTPAFAAVDDTYGTNPALDAACNAFLNPDENAEFTTYALGVTTTSDAPGVTIDVGAPYIVFTSSPVTTMSGINSGSEHLNGGSPNIFGNADITVTYPTAERRQNTQTTVTTTTSATNCHVHKMVGMNDPIEGHAGFTAPPGQQRNVPQPIVSTVVTTGFRVVENLTNYVDLTQSQIGAQVVICISPSNTGTKNPGAWSKKNGYTGTCSRSLYDSLFSKFDPLAPPTNSLPAT